MTFGSESLQDRQKYYSVQCDKDLTPRFPGPAARCALRFSLAAIPAVVAAIHPCVHPRRVEKVSRARSRTATGRDGPALSTCRLAPHPASPRRLRERLGTHRDIFDLPIEALTPAAFKKALG